MACCLSPSCCPGRRSARRPASKSVGRRRTSIGRPSKSTAASQAAQQPTPRPATVVPVVLNRLRRRLCQDDGSLRDDDGLTQRRTPCGCCRRCLGVDDGQPAATTQLERSPQHRPRSPPTPSKTTTSPGTTDVGNNTDFMTLFFRSCERIVLDNAPAIQEMLSAPAGVDDEDRQGSGTDDWTSNNTEPSSSSADPVEHRRRLSDNDDVAFQLRSDITETEPRHTDDAAASSCDKTDFSAERLIAPANSPVSAGSMLTSSFSDDVLRTRCTCSSSTRAADVADDGVFVRRRPSVSGQSPAAVDVVNRAADRSAPLTVNPLTTARNTVNVFFVTVKGRR